MKQFADDVGAGRKDFTIRNERKRHAKPGERIQLYTGMMHKNCRKLVVPDPICLYVKPITIHCMEGIFINGVRLKPPQEHLVIVLDGFKKLTDFYDFHLDGQYKVNKFLIRWCFL